MVTPHFLKASGSALLQAHLAVSKSVAALQQLQAQGRLLGVGSGRQGPTDSLGRGPGRAGQLRLDSRAVRKLHAAQPMLPHLYAGECQYLVGKRWCRCILTPEWGGLSAAP